MARMTPEEREELKRKMQQRWERWGHWDWRSGEKDPGCEALFHFYDPDAPAESGTSRPTEPPKV
jgi:hypothetical protein